MEKDDRLPCHGSAVEGKANRAVITLISGILDVPAMSVSIQSGKTSSQKRVLVSGIDKKDLLARLNSTSESVGFFLSLKPKTRNDSVTHNKSCLRWRSEAGVFETRLTKNVSFFAL